MPREIGGKPVHDDVIGPVHGKMRDINGPESAAQEIPTPRLANGLARVGQFGKPEWERRRHLTRNLWRSLNGKKEPSDRELRLFPMEFTHELASNEIPKKANKGHTHWCTSNAPDSIHHENISHPSISD